MYELIEINNKQIKSYFIHIIILMKLLNARELDPEHDL